MSIVYNVKRKTVHFQSQYLLDLTLQSMVEKYIKLFPAFALAKKNLLWQRISELIKWFVSAVSCLLF